VAQTNDGRFSGRVALVTGGASGIGAATVRRLLADGARVASLDLGGDPPDGALAVRGDVSDSAQVRRGQTPKGVPLRGPQHPSELALDFTVT